MKRGYVTVNLGSILMPAPSKKATRYTLSSPLIIHQSAAGWIHVHVSQWQKRVLTNAEFTGAGDADGNAEISGRFKEQTNDYF